MDTTREELRNHLVSVIAAAPELGAEEREHLADVFLDRLEADYRLAPRASPPPPADPHRARAGSYFPFFRFWAIAAAVLGVAVMLSLVTTSLFAFSHPPILLFVILLVLVFRYGHRRPRRRMYL